MPHMDRLWKKEHWSLVGKAEILKDTRPREMRNSAHTSNAESLQPQSLPLFRLIQWSHSFHDFKYNLLANNNQI